jgi:hypothetical protein
MATHQQIHANRRNALRSTGPKTPAGKAVSSRNALKHGLRARAALLPGEDKHAFERLFKAFRAHYRPLDRLQEILVEQMAVAYWKLSRLARIESHLYQDQSAAHSPLYDSPKDWFHRQNEPDPQPNKPKLTPDQLIARAFIQDASGFNTFSRLSYYEMRLERSFYRAHHELERLRLKPAPAQATP